jgi:SAM-dependent methyltransferase
MYGKVFASVYNAWWGDFARRVGPQVLDFYAGTPLGSTNNRVLDLCCGTGQFAADALGRGYEVEGIDISEDMLYHACQNNLEHVRSGRATFRAGDASDFTTDGGFGLVVSMFDALNHLTDVKQLAGCFRSVFGALTAGGVFVFDLNTHLGLQNWNSISVRDEPGIMIVNRGILIEDQHKAIVRISGFLRDESGRYDRFEETMSNTAFDLVEVRDLLLASGFERAYCARPGSLGIPLDTDPEQERRAYFVAFK